MNKLITTVLALFFSVSVFAQDTTKTHELSLIQVVGVRNDTREPITQTKVNCDSISFLNQQKDPFFVLDKVSPSIYSQSDNGQGNGYSYMRMRGLDQTRINFNLNGIPLNEMEDQGIYFSNMPGFYNYMSNISVQRGVGSSKFGQTSVAGSVNMESRDMTKHTGEVNFLIRSNLPDNHYYNFFYSPGLNKNGFAYQLGGTWQENQGFKEHSGNKGGSVFYGLGLYKKSNIFKVYGFSGIIHNQLAFYGVPMDSINSNYQMNLNSPLDRDTFNQNLVTANWVNFSKSNVKFNTSIYFNNVNGTYNTGGILFGVNSYQYGAMSNMVYEKNNNVLNIGLNSNIYQRGHFGSDNGGYYDFPSNVSKYSNTGYKKDVITFGKYSRVIGNFNTFVDLQLRSVWFNTNDSKTYNWTFLNPKIGFKHLDKNSSTYFSLGYTQREPTRTDIIQGIIQSNKLEYGNPDNSIFLSKYNSNLSPEKVTDIELGHNYHNKKIDINVNVYLMNINNEFVSTGTIDPYSGFMTKKSVESTLRAGFESDGRFNINKFNLFYSFQYQLNKLFDSSFDTTIHTSTIIIESIPFNPNLISSVGTSYKIDGFTFGIVGQYVSKMAIDMTCLNCSTPQNFSKEYWTLNGFCDYQFKQVSFGFKFNNLLNQKYYIPAGISANLPTYYVGQLQNWSVSFKYKL
jgi:iron complex outermembrane receptor protein